MIRLYDMDKLLEFADADAIVAHFSLSRTPAAADLAGMKAASDAGFPLHAAIDPCCEDIRGVRVLMLETDAATLRREYRQRVEDI